jgi:hypothetical protein
MSGWRHRPRASRLAFNHCGIGAVRTWPALPGRIGDNPVFFALLDRPAVQGEHLASAQSMIARSLGALTTGGGQGFSTAALACSRSDNSKTRLSGFGRWRGISECADCRPTTLLRQPVYGGSGDRCTTDALQQQHDIGTAVRSTEWVGDFRRLESMTWRWWPRFSPDGTH